MLRIVTDILLKPKPNQVRTVTAVTDEIGWLAVAQKVIARSDFQGAISFFFYRASDEMKYHGWHAHITGNTDGPIEVNTNNDRAERRAIYETFH